jgi:DNA replication protein DnaC
MDTTSEELREMCRELKLPTVAANILRLAEEAARQGMAPLAYLHELLTLEVAERKTRRTCRRIKEAAFPRAKTFDMFDFARAPHLPEARLRRLADGDYIKRAEPILLGRARHGQDAPCDGPGRRCGTGRPQRTLCQRRSARYRTR